MTSFQRSHVFTNTRGDVIFNKCYQPKYAKLSIISLSFYLINVQIDFFNPLVSYTCSYRMYLFSGTVSTCAPVVSGIRGS